MLVFLLNFDWNVMLP